MIRAYFTSHSTKKSSMMPFNLKEALLLHLFSIEINLVKMKQANPALVFVLLLVIAPRVILK